MFSLPHVHTRPCSYSSHVSFRPRHPPVFQSICQSITVSLAILARKAAASLAQLRPQQIFVCNQYHLRSILPQLTLIRSELSSLATSLSVLLPLQHEGRLRGDELEHGEREGGDGEPGSEAVQAREPLNVVVRCSRMTKATDE